MLSRLTPVVALLRRELVQTLRKGRSILFVALPLLFATAFVMVTWPGDAAVFAGQAGRFSDAIAFMLFGTLMVAGALFLPGVAGTAFVVEKEQDTLDSLRLTLIRPSLMVAAKLLSTIAFFTLLVIAMLPVLGSALFGLGLSERQFVEGFAALYIAVFCCGSLGLFCSMWFRKSAAASVASYSGMLTVFVGPFLGFAFASAIVDNVDALHFIDRGFLYWSSAIADMYPSFRGLRSNPEEFILFATTPLWPMRTVGRNMPPAYFPIMYQVGVSLLCFYGTWRLLKRVPRPVPVERAKPVDDETLLAVRRKRFPYYLIDPLKRKRQIEDGQNPMFLKEFRWGMLGRLTFLVRASYAGLVLNVLVLSTFLIATASTRMYDSMSLLFLILTCLSCLVCTGLLANTLTKEVEQQNLDMLRMTLLTPREIVLGKLSAGAITATPLAFSTAAVTVLCTLTVSIAWRDPGLFGVAQQGLATYLVCMGVCLCAALYVSVRARRTAEAIWRSYLLTLVFLIGFYVVVSTVYHVALFLLSTDPHAGYTLDRQFREVSRSAKAYILATFSPLVSYVRPYMERNIGSMLAFVPWLVSMVGSIAFGAFLCRASIQRFRLHHMRDR